MPVSMMDCRKFIVILQSSMKKILIALTAMLAVSLLVSAQRIPLRIMSQTPVQGTEEARSLIFDPYGLMWVGTDQGVRAFDGYRFRIYRSDAYSPGILPNNYVRSLSADQEDRLWIGTRDGLVRYDRRRGVFKTYHLKSDHARLINALFTTSDGTVWVGTNAGAARYDAEKDDFTSIDMPAGVISFAEDAHGHLYIGTWEGGLLRLDKKSGRMVGYPRLSHRNTVRSLLMDSRGRLWIGTWEDGIVRLDHPENEKDPGIHRMNEGRMDFRTFHQLVEDSVSHAIWGCCIEGLTRVDLDDETQVENYPILTFCYDMVTDGRGNLWVLTRNEGIVHLSTMPSPFNFFHLNLAGLELPVNRIQTIYTHDGNRFWLGLQPYGLALYDRQKGQVTYNNHIPGLAQFTGDEAIYARTVYDIGVRGEKREVRGDLWIGTDRGIIVWKEGEKARLLPRATTPFIGDREVKAFHSLPDGTMLVGLSSGVSIAISETEGRMLSLEEDGRDFSNCQVQSFFEDHQHRLWIATEGEGIIRLTKDFKAHQYAPARGNYPIDEATAVYEDGDHRLWAISNSGGLFLYADDTDSFNPVNHLYHLGMGSIYSIQGAGGHLWLSTDKGLVRLTPSGKEGAMTTIYNEEDGIENIRFSPNGAFSYNDTLYYGNATGFFSFNPSLLSSPSTLHAPHSSLIVTELVIDDRPFGWLDSLQQREITECQPFFTKRITIPAGVKKFSVQFALLTYQKQEQCHYAYLLEDYDHDWNMTEADDRTATYQNLPEGRYELRLRATDSYGRTVELPYSISVRVLPPWYRTWWAYLIYVLLLGAAVYGISQWYKDRVNRRARLQQRVSELLHYREMMVMKQFFAERSGKAEREGARKTLEAEEQQHSSPDEQFIQKAIDCVKRHLDDSDYDREQFASDMCVSSSTLYNKLRALTGQSVTAFISSIRLKEACRILRQQPGITITQLSMEVGFNTPKYFTKLFKKEFGVSPSEYLTSEDS